MRTESAVEREFQAIREHTDRIGCSIAGVAPGGYILASARGCGGGYEHPGCISHHSYYLVAVPRRDVRAALAAYYRRADVASRRAAYGGYELVTMHQPPPQPCTAGVQVIRTVRDCHDLYAHERGDGHYCSDVAVALG